MIKIQISNLQQKKQEYLNAILNNVAFRVSVLQKSLSHLRGAVVDFSSGDFVSFKPITKRIIEIVGDNAIMPNGQIGYTNSINNYLAFANQLGNINLVGLSQFCHDMLANNNQRLSELLLRDAADLLNHNNAILNSNGLNTPRNIAVIKLAFDYSYETIATEIKTYYRINKLVSACPYCNKVETTHTNNATGEVIESFQLDHFFDKATYPLLAYSLFNLVPSDQTCNVTNKGTTEFTPTNHLNPHEQGYDNRMKFVPIGLTPSFDVSLIEVEILENQGTALYAKMNGNNPPNLERYALGNLNVFKIRSKYKNEKRRTKDIFEKLHSNNKNIKHILKYLQSLNGLNREESYVEWYKDKINDSFYPETFNDNSYSKFCRDIHDYYYSLNSTRLNGYIMELIDQN